MKFRSTLFTLFWYPTLHMWRKKYLIHRGSKGLLKRKKIKIIFVLCVRNSVFSYFLWGHYGHFVIVFFWWHSSNSIYLLQIKIHRAKFYFILFYYITILFSPEGLLSYPQMRYLAIYLPWREPFLAVILIRHLVGEADTATSWFTPDFKKTKIRKSAKVDDKSAKKRD